ncbi:MULTISPECIES: F0F1 ATP synthase subunit gamma [Burkholderia]|uniref:F0F1 ATP synthase subunit gamma n=1 Tax=Burkholderia TaxID=32008 RepID=UPI00075C02CD|nr:MULTISPECIES: FoF1 ATP synthase subunit gamma [Burkholderia]AOJ72921.1 ATP synthase F1 subunit gamma [Burkholderia savannae]KVG44848.1 ATP synthase F1 subunit gamma [Burkholderia sp. MSMB0265]KVG79660.1 ATP synthase F1 subunit gamma [Burkholderia sp. MSMB2040]KVG95973.1 ATP synthase F1 subunit gamma [Burkholderia sp. MSMB2041]KVG97080.1 ATP synthase F1 subunit gamma [Burkholderia sp. MSMB2042]
MSDKLAAIEARTDTARQLQTVIGAMRGVAAARAHEAQQRLPGIRASAATVGAAIGDALSAGAPSRDAAPARRAAPNARLVIVMCSEQGFVGAYNAQMIEYATRPDGAASREYMMVGTRGAMLAEAGGVPLVWSMPMASHADDVVHLANRITDALYAHLAERGAQPVSIVHAMPGAAQRLDVIERRLLPFDYARFDSAPRAQPPLVHLPPAALLAELAQAYVFVELCEAAMLAFAAENEARTRAMIAARESVERTLGELLQAYRIARQDEITADIVELAASAL